MEHSMPPQKTEPAPCSEYAIACREERRDMLLGNVAHLFLYVTPDGIIRTMNGLSKEMALLNPDTSIKPNSTGSPPSSRPQNDARHSDEGVFFEMTSIETMVPWLGPDFDSFISSDRDHFSLSKTMHVRGEIASFDIRFDRVKTASGDTTGAIVSIMAASTISRFAQERRELELMRDTMRQVRAFCHDFSQPLMVIAGYWELIKGSKPALGNPPLENQINTIQHQIDKLNAIYQKLRAIVIHCRQRLESIQNDRSE